MCAIVSTHRKCGEVAYVARLHGSEYVAFGGGVPGENRRGKYLLRNIVNLHFSLRSESPTAVSVINHLAGHTAVNTNVFACDKACLV